MNDIYRDGELYLYGDVGDLWFEESFTASDVVEALSLHGADNPIKVHINSGGGIATEGAAIYSILSAHKGDVSVEIDGIAASAASIIAMAGNSITMRLGSVMMVHDPAGYFMGYTEGDLDEAKRQLSAMATTMAEVYAEHTGQTALECREDMKATLWLTPESAVDKGYATRAGNDNAITAAAFDYRIYANVPDKLVALATEKNWKLKGSQTKAATSAVTQPIGKEIVMTEKERADQLAAELEALKTTASADAAKLKAMEDKDADTERKAAVMALPEAEKRHDLATALADQGMTADVAKNILASSPEVELQTIEENSGSTQQQYANGRVAASGQALPNGGGSHQRAKATINTTSIYAGRKAAVSQ